jgi:uncharacterized membrane protein
MGSRTKTTEGKMLIQKTFHIKKSLNDTKASLANIQAYRRELEGVNRAVITADGIAHFEIETGAGFGAAVDLAEIATGSENEILFQSLGGDMEISGMVEFFEIRNNLTEIVLTLDYSIKSSVLRAVDSLTGSVDHFLNRQLSRIQMHFEGVMTWPEEHAAPLVAQYAA